MWHESLRRGVAVGRGFRLRSGWVPFPPQLPHSENIMRFVAAFLFLGAMLAVTTYSEAQQPGQPGQKGKGQFGKGGGGGGGFGGFAGFGQIGQILSTNMQDTLKMTDDQKKQLADLQKDVDAKLAKILTEDQ